MRTYTITYSGITRTYTVGVNTGPPGATDWDSITDKPTTFPPIIGSGAGDAVAGNDPRLTDSRTPLSHTHLLDLLDGPGGLADGRVLSPDGIGPGVKWRKLTASEVGAAPALGTDDNYVTDAEKTKLANLSGTNTGDQDLSKLIQSDTTGITGADAVTNIVSLTRAEYDALATKSASTLYIIT